MSWARIMVPLSGRADDAAVLAAGQMLAEPFGAQVAGVFAPPDIADLAPWMSDGMVGGVELAAIEAVLVAKRVPEKQREAVMAAATEKLAQRLRDGQAPKIKVFDKAAPSQRPVVVPMPEVQRARERAAPVR